MLWMFQRVMFGELTNPKNKELKDLNAREIVVMAPLILMIFVLGLYPKLILDSMAPSIDKMISVTKAKQQIVAAPATPTAGMMPAGQSMPMPTGHPSVPPAGHEGMQMPAGHPAMPSATEAK
jgi:NADH-quinone oxidoreductase subunit M